MKFITSLFLVVVTVVTINAIDLCCGKISEDFQEFSFEDLRSFGNSNQGNQNGNTKNVAEKLRTIEKVVTNYNLYAEEAKQNLKLSDPLNVIDTSEFLVNGIIEYRNASIGGLNNVMLKNVNFDEIASNKFSVHATLKKAEVAGDYVVPISNKIETGQFYITLKNVEFNAKFQLDKYMEIQPKINADSITFSHHESMYTNEEVLKELNNENTEVPKPYAYYYKYLNNVIKAHLANEMAASFMPLIAKRLQQTLAEAILFPMNNIEVPKTNVNVIPGVQVNIFKNMLHDLWNTNQIQKMTNYTINRDQIDFIFSFSSFDLRGTTNWALAFNTGSTYQGKATYAIDNIQTIIVASKSNNNQNNITLRFAKTTVNGLTMMLDADEHCESIRNFAYQRLPKVLEQSLEIFINEQSMKVLRNQITLIGEANHY